MIFYALLSTLFNQMLQISTRVKIIEKFILHIFIIEIIKK